jgi:hypothetical protein
VGRSLRILKDQRQRAVRSHDLEHQSSESAADESAAQLHIRTTRHVNGCGSAPGEVDADLYLVRSSRDGQCNGVQFPDVPSDHTVNKDPKSAVASDELHLPGQHNPTPPGGKRSHGIFFNSVPT